MSENDEWKSVKNIICGFLQFGAKQIDRRTLIARTWALRESIGSTAHRMWCDRCIRLSRSRRHCDTDWPTITIWVSSQFIDWQTTTDKSGVQLAGDINNNHLNGILVFFADHLLDDLQTSMNRTQSSLGDNQYLSPSNTSTVVHERSVSPGGKVSDTF